MARRTRAELMSQLEALAAEPALAKIMTWTLPGIRPAAYERYVELRRGGGVSSASRGVPSKCHNASRTETGLAFSGWAQRRRTPMSHHLPGSSAVVRDGSLAHSTPALKARSCRGCLHQRAPPGECRPVYQCRERYISIGRYPRVGSGQTIGWAGSAPGRRLPTCCGARIRFPGCLQAQGR